MHLSIRKFMTRAVLAFAIAMPTMATVQISSADAGHKNLRRGAAIAGAIIGGAIIYNHYRKNRKYRHHGRYYRNYGSRYVPQRRVRYRNHHHHGYHHRHGHRGRLHYHPY